MSARYAAPSGRVTNAITVDVEDYFHASVFDRVVPRAAWHDYESRVVPNTHRLLDLFDEQRVKGTFFVLGWVADKFPELVREIAGRGHELASHGYHHQLVYMLTPAQFRDDIRRAKGTIEQLGATRVRGYRAPSFSIGTGNLWAFDCLARAGYRYSSSVYPIRHDHYGMPDAPRFAWRPRGPHGVLELPVSTVRLRGRNLPAGGGGYFRLMPYALSRWLLRRINSRDGQAGIFYFHPWELDPGQPRPPGLDARTRFRHYLNLGRMEARLARLTGDFAWDRMDRIFLEST